jgi:uncharacterized membrane protein YjfL (UPF0719 family)
MGSTHTEGQWCCHCVEGERQQQNNSSDGLMTGCVVLGLRCILKSHITFASGLRRAGTWGIAGVRSRLHAHVYAHALCSLGH